MRAGCKALWFWEDRAVVCLLTSDLSAWVGTGEEKDVSLWGCHWKWVIVRKPREQFHHGSGDMATPPVLVIMAHPTAWETFLCKLADAESSEVTWCQAFWVPCEIWLHSQSTVRLTESGSPFCHTASILGIKRSIFSTFKKLYTHQETILPFVKKKHLGLHSIIFFQYAFSASVELEQDHRLTHTQPQRPRAYTHTATETTGLHTHTATETTGLHTHTATKTTGLHTHTATETTGLHTHTHTATETTGLLTHTHTQPRRPWDYTHTQPQRPRDYTHTATKTTGLHTHTHSHRDHGVTHTHTATETTGLHTHTATETTGLHTHSHGDHGVTHTAP